MKKNFLPKSISLIALATLIGGCGFLAPVKAPELQTYQINLQKQQNPQPSNQTTKYTQSILKIAQIQSASPYNNKLMYYSSDGNLTKSFAYSRWIAYPTNMFSNYLLQSLNEANIYRAVVSVSYPGITQYSLNLKILELRQNIKNNQANNTLYVLAEVSNNQNGKFVKNHLFKLETLSDIGPKGLALATDANMDAFNNELIAWLKGESLPPRSVTSVATPKPVTPVATNNNNPTTEEIQNTNQTSQNSDINNDQNASKNEFFEL